MAKPGSVAFDGRSLLPLTRGRRRSTGPTAPSISNGIEGDAPPSSVGPSRRGPSRYKLVQPKGDRARGRLSSLAAFRTL